MKHLLLNRDNVIVDIVDTVKPVRKNKNGITVLCGSDEAQGYVASDNDTIIAKFGSQFQPTYYDIFKIYAVEEVPDKVQRLMFKYAEVDGKMEFVMNDDPYPETNVKLTGKTTDLENMILEMSEIIYA